MKLNEVYSRPLKEVIAELDLSDMKIHTDEDGDVKAVELKYTDKKPGGEKTEKYPLPGKCSAGVRWDR